MILISFNKLDFLLHYFNMHRQIWEKLWVFIKQWSEFTKLKKTSVVCIIYKDVYLSLLQEKCFRGSFPKQIVHSYTYAEVYFVNSKTN